jgi:hypothetical protein
MARLYVVNCTGQNRIVNYRLDYTVDEQGRRTSERLVPYKSINIPARGQMPFGGDLFPGQIEQIVQQLEQTCGAVNVNEVRTAKARGPVKMIWSEGKPVPLPILKDVVAHNMKSLSELGEERRRNLALVADVQLSNLIERPSPKMELEFEQVEEDPDLPAKRLTEGLRISRQPSNDAPPQRSRRARKAAAG